LKSSDASGAYVDSLPIQSVEFLGGLAAPGGWRPDADLPEIAFAGRSNVGKSSLLNRLARSKTLARVSNTPGRTREINFFRINQRFVLVDLPGYGYARVSKESKALWRPLIDSYLGSSPQLRGVVQLLDIRHDPTDDDLGMLERLAAIGVPTLIVATKIDKLTARAASARVDALASGLSLDQDAIVPMSSKTGAGRDELAAALVALLDQPPWRTLAPAS
jgi:GTP-binding protein